MQDLNKLQEKIQRMLDGEKKRRESVLKFLEEMEKVLISIAPVLWSGSSASHDSTDAVFLEIEGKEKSVYFRWESHYGESKTEYTGFLNSKTGYLYWGTPIEEIKGPLFWWMVRTIIEWLPEIISLLDEKDASREKKAFRGFY